MDTNETKTDVVTDTNDNKDVVVDVDTDTDVDVDTDEAPKPKKTESLEAKRAKLKRMLKQLDKKAGIDTEAETETRSSNSNDLGEKAFLAVNGIKTAEERAFFNKMKKETGKSADDLIESTYFQSEFSSFKEKQASANATPTGSKRAGNSSTSTVDYWLAKGELPPASEVQLRRDVVNARIKKEQSQGQFYNS